MTAARGLLAAGVLLCLPGLRDLPAEEVSPAPTLTVTASQTDPIQGGVVVLEITSDRPLERLRVAEPRRGAWLEREPGGTVFRGLAGVDLETAPGPWPLLLEGAVEGGGTFSHTTPLSVASGHFAVEPLQVDSKFVEPPPAAQKRIASDRRKVERVWQTGERARRWTGPFANPIAAPLKNNFGVRRVFNGEPRSPHGGVDFSAPVGAAVSAPAPGRVALAEDLYYSGGTVILDHGGGLFTMYFHLSRIRVKAGSRVEAGARIGDVGATGRVTGPHLHWAARLDGARVQPLALLDLPRWPLPGR